MALGLYSLIEAALLCVNAIAVLNEERFLSKVGWATDTVSGFGEQPGMKSQIINLIRSVRMVMRKCAQKGAKGRFFVGGNVPLIIVNTVTIVLLLLFG